MRKHGGTPSWRDKHVTLAAISPPGVARGRFVGGQQSDLAGCKPPPLFTRGASACSSQGRRQGEPWGASPRPSAPTYLPTYLGALLCGCWGRCLGHLVVWLLWGFRFLQFCSDGGEDVLEGGGGGGLRCRFVPGEMVPCWVLRVLLYGDGGGGVVFRRPSVLIVVKGVEGDAVVVPQAMEGKEGPRAGGGRSWLRLPGRCPWCLSWCLPREGPRPGPTRCRPLSPASTPGGSRVSLGGLGGRIGSIARCPWGGLGCWPVWRRCPLRGGGGRGVAARSGSCCWCSAFWSAVAAGDTGRGCMGWSGSCSSRVCWLACGHGAVAASRCWMAGRTS